MPAHIRSFIAIELPPVMQEKIQLHTRQLRQQTAAAVRWVTAGNIHLTLKFLGEIPPTDIERVRAMLAAEAQLCRGFVMTVGGLGTFPNSQRPRVVWIGIQAPQPLFDLQQRIEHACRKLGLVAEERKFSPHLTLGRVSRNIHPEQNRHLSQTLLDCRISSLGEVQVSQICLFQSELKSGGAVYTPLFHAPLAK